MKKIWILAIILVAALAFTACGGNDTTTTTPPAADPPPVETPATPEPPAEPDPVAEDPTEEVAQPEDPTEVVADDPTEEAADDPTEAADDPTADEPTADEPTADEPTPAADEPPAAAAGFPEGFVYHMAYDPYIQGLAIGTTTNLAGTPFLEVNNAYQGSQTAVATIIDHNGSRAIRISGRTFQNDGIFIPNSGVEFTQSDIVTIYGTFDNIAYEEGEWFVAMLNGDNNGWLELNQMDRWEMDPEETGTYNFRLRRNFAMPPAPMATITTAPEDGSPAGVRVQTNRSNSDFDTSDLIITSILIERR
ncbi:MAG: hypothetical protein FWF81_08250 [Defluviitaleaceae bacterium]|nr:hypothetical protein [Defluviitaleaceae bacterium]